MSDESNLYEPTPNNVAVVMAERLHILAQQPYYSPFPDTPDTFLGDYWSIDPMKTKKRVLFVAIPENMRGCARNARETQRKGLLKE